MNLNDLSPGLAERSEVGSQEAHCLIPLRYSLPIIN